MLPLVAVSAGSSGTVLVASFTIWPRVGGPRFGAPVKADIERLRASGGAVSLASVFDDACRGFQRPENKLPHRPPVEGKLPFVLMAELSLLCRFLMRFAEATLSLPVAVRSSLSRSDRLLCRAAKWGTGTVVLGVAVEVVAALVVFLARESLAFIGILMERVSDPRRYWKSSGGGSGSDSSAERWAVSLEEALTDR